MGRFNTSTYDPTADSSSGSAKLGKPGDLVLVIGAGLCACGCGDTSANIEKGKVRFIVGHDARLKGALIRAHLTNTMVTTSTDGKVQRQSAATLAGFHGWGPHLIKAKQRFDAKPKTTPRKAPAKKAAAKKAPAKRAAAKPRANKAERQRKLKAVK